MFSVGFIIRSYEAAARNRRKPGLNTDHLGTMIQTLDEYPAFRARVEALHQELIEQLEDGPTSRILCPECMRPMGRVNLEGVEIDACPHCRGTWFDEGELAYFTSLDEDVEDLALRDRASKYHCPHCTTPMREMQFKAPFNLLVDRCPHGHGVYCEANEFDWAMTLAHDQQQFTARHVKE
jgi:Zn-finger nucleic acid-binding protein